MQKKKGQQFEVCEYIYLCGLVTHATFGKALGMITEYNIKHGDYSVTLIGTSRGFHLSRVQIENMKLILAGAQQIGHTADRGYRED